MRRASLLVLLVATAIAGCGSSESGDSGSGDTAGAGDAAGGASGNPGSSASSGGSSASSGSSGSGGDAATPAPGDAGDSEFPQTANCNAVTNGAAPIDVLLVTGQAPKMTGGTIVDGTYHLTSFRKFTQANTGTNDTAYRETMVISNGGTKIERVMVSKKLGKTARATGTQIATGTVLAVTYTCPPQRPVDVEYTAGPNRFEILADRGKEHYVYERR